MLVILLVISIVEKVFKDNYHNYLVLPFISDRMFNDISLGVGEYKCVKRYGSSFQVVKQCAHFHNMRSSHILVTFVFPYMVVTYYLFFLFFFWLSAEIVFTQNLNKKPQIQN